MKPRDSKSSFLDYQFPEWAFKEAQRQVPVIPNFSLYLFINSNTICVLLLGKSASPNQNLSGIFYLFYHRALLRNYQVLYPCESNYDYVRTRFFINIKERFSKRFLKKISYHKLQINFPKWVLELKKLTQKLHNKNSIIEFL